VRLFDADGVFIGCFSIDAGDSTFDFKASGLFGTSSGLTE
jgi:hypothetical protein